MKSSLFFPSKQERQPISKSLSRFYTKLNLLNLLIISMTLNPCQAIRNYGTALNPSSNQQPFQHRILQDGTLNLLYNATYLFTNFTQLESDFANETDPAQNYWWVFDLQNTLNSDAQQTRSQFRESSTLNLINQQSTYYLNSDSLDEYYMELYQLVDVTYGETYSLVNEQTIDGTTQVPSSNDYFETHYYYEDIVYVLRAGELVQFMEAQSDDPDTVWDYTSDSYFYQQDTSAELDTIYQLYIYPVVSDNPYLEQTFFTHESNDKVYYSVDLTTGLANEYESKSQSYTDVNGYSEMWYRLIGYQEGLFYDYADSYEKVSNKNGYYTYTEYQLVDRQYQGDMQAYYQYYEVYQDSTLNGEQEYYLEQIVNPYYGDVWTNNTQSLLVNGQYQTFEWSSHYWDYSQFYDFVWGDDIQEPMEPSAGMLDFWLTIFDFDAFTSVYDFVSMEQLEDDILDFYNYYSGDSSYESTTDQQYISFERSFYTGDVYVMTEYYNEGSYDIETKSYIPQFYFLQEQYLDVNFGQVYNLNYILPDVYDAVEYTYWDFSNSTDDFWYAVASNQVESFLENAYSGTIENWEFEYDQYFYIEEQSDTDYYEFERDTTDGTVTIYYQDDDSGDKNQYQLNYVTGLVTYQDFNDDSLYTEDYLYTDVWYQMANQATDDPSWHKQSYYQDPSSLDLYTSTYSRLYYDGYASYLSQYYDSSSDSEYFYSITYDPVDGSEYMVYGYYEDNQAIDYSETYGFYADPDFYQGEIATDDDSTDEGGDQSVIDDTASQQTDENESQDVTNPDPIAEPSQIQNDQEQTQETKSKAWRWIILGILLIAGVGIGGVAASKKKQGPEEENQALNRSATGRRGTGHPNSLQISNSIKRPSVEEEAEEIKEESPRQSLVKQQTNYQDLSSDKIAKQHFVEGQNKTHHSHTHSNHLGIIDIEAQFMDKEKQQLSKKDNTDQETLYSDQIESEVDNFDNLELPQDKEFKNNKMSTRDRENIFNKPLSPTNEALKVNAYKPRTIQALKKDASSDGDDSDNDANLKMLVGLKSISEGQSNASHHNFTGEQNDVEQDHSIQKVKEKEQEVVVEKKDVQNSMTHQVMSQNLHSQQETANDHTSISNVNIEEKKESKALQLKRPAGDLNFSSAKKIEDSSHFCQNQIEDFDVLQQDLQDLQQNQSKSEVQPIHQESKEDDLLSKDEKYAYHDKVMSSVGDMHIPDKDE